MESLLQKDQNLNKCKYSTIGIHGKFHEYYSMIFFYEGLFYEASITMRRHQGKRT